MLVNNFIFYNEAVNFVLFTKLINMKQFILSILTMIAGTIAYGQDEYQKLPSLGIHFFVNDFETASELRSTNLANTIKNKQYAKTARMNPGLAVSYVRGVGKYVDISVSLAGSFVDYAVPSILPSGKTGSSFFMEGAFTGNLKVLSDKFYINPFLTLGIGGFSYKSSFGAFVPAGVGMQIKISKDIFFVANSQYRMPVTEKGVYHFYHSLGVTAPLVERKEPVVIPPPPPVVVDRDNDGVLDSIDKCPDVAGLAALQGCPDRDADGIADADDKCPDVAGLGKYGGCPIPDTDADGINDEQDKCINEKGFARYQGCPIPDTDKDGVNDEEDKCPSRPGPASNQGCPEIAKEVIEKINFAAKNIFFATGSSKLLAKSNKSLDEVAKLLAADESLKIQIDGHTDNTGKPEKNQTLSEARANSVKAYLVSKGVADARAATTGYGDTKPVADNKTAAGRAKNRRTEMTVTNY